MAKEHTWKSKPKKPSSDFLLTAHRKGQWCKKILGKLHDFGTDADAALQKYLDKRDGLQAGRTPTSLDGMTVAGLCNRYLKFKESLFASGELSPRTFHQDLRGCRAVADHFGRDRRVEDVRQEDFTSFRTVLAKGRGVHALGGMIRVTRMVFLFGQDEGLIEKHVQFGKTFKPPSRESLRRSPPLGMGLSHWANESHPMVRLILPDAAKEWVFRRCSRWTKKRFIRVLGADVGKKVDKLLAFEGAVSKFFEGSSQHVYSGIVSRFWNSW